MDNNATQWNGTVPADHLPSISATDTNRKESKHPAFPSYAGER